MKIRFVSFSGRGEALGKKLADQLNGESTRLGGHASAAKAGGQENRSLGEWTGTAFEEADAIVFIGAVQIAVRAIAPYIRHKTQDPAVIAVDETGQFVIPILGGHLGGANDLAGVIAGLCGGIPVITTATDRNGIFAVDEWAKRQNCAIRNPEEIKRVSSCLLAGGRIRFRSDWPIAGTPPDGIELTEEEECDVRVSIVRHEKESADPVTSARPLYLVPRIVAVGIGCRKGTAKEQIDRAYESLLAGAGICPEAVSMICSADRKENEPGLLDFCRERGLKLRVFTAEQLNEAEGVFSGSDFVRQITGTDNVCERSAVLGSGGKLLVRKQAGDGVTAAAAAGWYRPDWRWQYG